jgi:hypothetical protein
LLLLSFAPGAIADSLAPQPTAFTAWIDFHKQSPDLPIWIERIESQTIQADGTIPQQTTCRIRFRHFPGLVDQVLLRIYFDDQPNAQPVLTAWSEIGNRVLGPQTLGQGLGLPSSETVTIPMSGVDYVDIQTPHSGATIRGVLALALRPAATSEGLDFAGATAPITDPFGNSAPAVTGSDDSLLFGRVKATLEPGVVPLGTINSPDQAAEFDFPLQQPPLIALLTFEILNADIANPPDLSVNGTDLGPVNVIVTDLADPALTASVEAARPDVVYRYGGWLKVQKVIPGSLLIAGTNSVIVSTPGNPAPVALRSIEIQLKYTQDAATP